MGTGGDGEISDVHIDRAQLLADRSLFGSNFCQAYAKRVDIWLKALFAQVLGDQAGISLVAVGGYGRAHLSPQSDLDVMLLHDDWNESDLAEAAQGLWMPVWDAHISLGHSVRTIDQMLELAADDLDTATSLLSLRHIAGDTKLSSRAARLGLQHWRDHKTKWVPQLIADAREREVRNGEVAYLLEPDIKNSSGGLRDVSAIGWIEAAGIPVLDQEKTVLNAANDILLAVRVELHRSLGRKGEKLLLEEQDEVAEALGAPDADFMMSRLSSGARAVAWTVDNVLHRAERRLAPNRMGADRVIVIDRGVQVSGGLVRLTADAEVSEDPALMLRLALAAAERNAPIERNSLDRLVEDGPDIPNPWPDPVRELFVKLLRTGASAIPVVEALDHTRLFTRLLPEWEPTRSKVQRNQYHRFTVDRHLLEAAAVANDLADTVERPDLLVVGALLHDIGKGYEGDHTEVGVELIDTIARDMGFAVDDVRTLKRLCYHHLLLADIATRRDLEDPGTIESVAVQVRTPEFLYLLAALTEADSIATGPAAWSRWKARLVGELVHQVEEWLATGRLADRETSFPDQEQMGMIATHDQLVRGEGDTLVVIARDRPGLLSRVVGALALNALSIREARTHTSDGKALEVVRVVHATGEDTPIDWSKVVETVESVMSSDEDLAPRIEERSRTRLKRDVRDPSPVVDVRVDFDNDISATSTVLEVAGPDRLGLLYELSNLLAGAGLDLQQTHVQTISGDVVDAFYVHTVDGEKVTDLAVQRELRTALLRVLNRDPDN